MYITGLGQIDKPQEKKKAAKAGTGGFSDLLVSSDAEGTQSTSTASVSSLSQLLFLQEIDDEESHKREAVNQGFDALEYLDKIKKGLLSGSLSNETIINLESLLEKFRKNFSDPNLAKIIDEIELRARVEIAKATRN